MNTVHHQHERGPQPPAPSTQQGEQRQVLDAEILGPEDDRHSQQQYSHYQQQTGQHRFFQHVWTGGTDQRACLVPSVSLFLFLFCLLRFGLLAAIGFAVFQLIGAVIGSMAQLRMIMEGRRPNPWLWRAGNWAVSFVLTAWLAGGLS